MNVCEDLLRSLTTVCVLAAAAWCLYTLSRVFADTDCCSVHPHTLIALKVKLSD